MVAALLPLAALAPILVLPLAVVLGARWRRHARGGCSRQGRWSWPSGGRRRTRDRSRKLSCPRQQLTGHPRRDEVPPHGNDRIRLQPIGVTIGDTAIPARKAGGDGVASLGQAGRDLVLERRTPAGLDRDRDHDQCERSDEDECRRSQVATTPHVPACTRPRRRSTVAQHDRGTLGAWTSPRAPMVRSTSTSASPRRSRRSLTTSAASCPTSSSSSRTSHRPGVGSSDSTRACP